MQQFEVNPGFFEHAIRKIGYGNLSLRVIGVSHIWLYCKEYYAYTSDYGGSSSPCGHGPEGLYEKPFSRVEIFVKKEKQ